MRYQRLAAAAPLLLCLGLSACGGGGGGGSSPAPSASISYSINSLTFNAAGPWADFPSPASQSIVGTVTGTVNGTLYIIVQVNNPELVSISDVVLIGSNSGAATVTPASPSDVGIGTRTGSLVIRACVNDPQCTSNHLVGSPRTINITYTVPSNVEGDSVSPRVVASSSPGSVILRGRNFASGATVSFGATAATSVNVVSSTEIRADYPALAAGTHTVSINSGAIAFTGALSAIESTNYPAAYLPYPTADVSRPISLEYDAERRALLVAVATQPQSQILRYARAGDAWSSPTSTALDNVRQIRLSSDGSKLLVLRSLPTSPESTVMEERDPVTLALLTSTPLNAPVIGVSFALMNDGNALVQTGSLGIESPAQYMYATARRQFIAMPFSSPPFHTVASHDGSLGFYMGSRSYNSTTGRLTEVSGETFSFAFAEPSTTLTGDKIQTGNAVLDSQLQLIGTVPFEHVAAVINRDGTRLFALHPGTANDPKLNVYDLTQQPIIGGAFPEFVRIAGPIDLISDPGIFGVTSQLEMTISPDGRTLFMGGFMGIVVMPAP